MSGTAVPVEFREDTGAGPIEFLGEEPLVGQTSRSSSSRIGVHVDVLEDTGAGPIEFLGEDVPRPLSVRKPTWSAGYAEDARAISMFEGDGGVLQRGSVLHMGREEDCQDMEEYDPALAVFGDAGDIFPPPLETAGQAPRLPPVRRRHVLSSKQKRALWREARYLSEKDAAMEPWRDYGHQRQIRKRLYSSLVAMAVRDAENLKRARGVADEPHTRAVAVFQGTSSASSSAAVPPPPPPPLRGRGSRSGGGRGGRGRRSGRGDGAEAGAARLANGLTAEVSANALPVTMRPVVQTRDHRRGSSDEASRRGASRDPATTASAGLTTARGAPAAAPAPKKKGRTPWSHLPRLSLCERLRLARGLPPKPGVSFEEYQLSAKASEAAARPVGVDSPKPTTENPCAPNDGDVAGRPRESGGNGNRGDDEYGGVSDEPKRSETEDVSKQHQQPVELVQPVQLLEAQPTRAFVPRLALPDRDVIPHLPLESLSNPVLPVEDVPESGRSPPRAQATVETSQSAPSEPSDEAPSDQWLPAQGSDRSRGTGRGTRRGLASGIGRGRGKGRGKAKAMSVVKRPAARAERERHRSTTVAEPKRSSAAGVAKANSGQVSLWSTARDKAAQTGATGQELVLLIKRVYSEMRRQKGLLPCQRRKAEELAKEAARAKAKAKAKAKKRRQSGR
eukprot:TRINITY_DN45636_c0_g1_i1.p1 TRINITY_DN45636_c0_g1~~TRINITY_DN45636_c0_g1_i1.p1  ORF type:complete len:676 (-),score=97.21 TRINITY_DN45636_c0_g1_i1:38-2065(-)